MTAGQICGDSFCGLMGCDTVLCGSRDSGQQTAIKLWVYRIMRMCEIPRVCVEVMGNPQTSGTCRRRGFLCSWRAAFGSVQVHSRGYIVYCIINCKRRLDSTEEARLSTSYCLHAELLVTCLNSVPLVPRLSNHFRSGLFML